MARRDTAVYWWLGALALLILGAGGTVAYKMSRGIRNNNPGNIRKSGIKWQGMRGVQDDPDFVQFIAPEWGIRAMVRDLRGDFRSGQDTVRKLINEWAPPTENNTSAYVSAVSRAMGVNPDDKLSFDYGQVLALVKAIIRHENGINPYSDETIREGIALAS